MNKEKRSKKEKAVNIENNSDELFPDINRNYIIIKDLIDQTKKRQLLV
jgi:hypothetical protein